MINPFLSHSSRFLFFFFLYDECIYLLLNYLEVKKQLPKQPLTPLSDNNTTLDSQQNIL